MTPSIRVLIIDDQPAIRKYIQALIEQDPSFTVVGSCGSVQEGIALIKNISFEVLLLDIHLPDGTGFDILSKVSPFYFKVIFLTAFQEHALKAIKFGALDYLLKPIDKSEFRSAIDKVLRSLPLTKGQFVVTPNEGRNNNRLALKSQHFIQIVALEDIVYCKSDSGYTEFYLSDGRNILTSKYIKEYEDKLPAKLFFKPHQSYIVNLQFIDRYHKEGYLLLKNKVQIPVAVRRRENVLEYLKAIH